MTSLTTAEWHQRYLQQARWTENLRAYLFEKANLQHASKILDVGCGTGVLEHELYEFTAKRLFAIDIDASALNYARKLASQVDYTHCDCLSLPFVDNAFDITFSHFFLLWIRDVRLAMAEMVRVTRSDGYILALAEPDYGGRIDFPHELSKIGAWQNEALQKQGANPYIGRKLRSVFHEAGLSDIEVGVMGGQWSDDAANRDATLEWEVIHSDLGNHIEFLKQAKCLEALDQSARQNGQRMLFVPTFYAIGKVKSLD